MPAIKANAACTTTSATIQVYCHLYCVCYGCAASVCEFATSPACSPRDPSENRAAVHLCVWVGPCGLAAITTSRYRAQHLNDSEPMARMKTKLCFLRVFVSRSSLRRIPIETEELLAVAGQNEPRFSHLLFGRTRSIRPMLPHLIIYLYPSPLTDSLWCERSLKKNTRDQAVGAPSPITNPILIIKVQPDCTSMQNYFYVAIAPEHLAAHMN